MKKIINILTAAGCILLICCVLSIGRDFSERIRSDMLSYRLKAYEKGEAEGAEEKGLRISPDTSLGEGAEKEGGEDSEKGALNEFEKGLAKLCDENPDMKGFISMAEGKISYPVMQSEKEDRDFYLTHDFKKEKSSHGSIYLDSACGTSEKTSGSLIVYGHNMKDGSMFGSLGNYAKESYMEKAPYIKLWLFDGGGRPELNVYKAVTSFNTSAIKFKNEIFSDMISFDEPEDYDKFNVFIKEQKGGIIREKIDKDDDILVLVTCEYSEENGRFFVIAKKISQ